MISGRPKKRAGVGMANLFRRLPGGMVLMAQRHAEPYTFASEIELESPAVSGQPRAARETDSETSLRLRMRPSRANAVHIAIPMVRGFKRC
jgi:hypothetical protein